MYRYLIGSANSLPRFFSAFAAVFILLGLGGFLLMPRSDAVAFLSVTSVFVGVDFLFAALWRAHRRASERPRVRRVKA